MKIVTNKSALLPPLHAAQGVLEKKNTIPILACLYLDARDGQVGLRATDLDLGITIPFDATVEKPGAVCVPGKRLFDIVRSLPDGDITITADQNHHAKVTGGSASFRLVGFAPKDFPVEPDIKGNWLSTPASIWPQFIGRILFAITSEESRYALNGGKLEISSDRIRLVATDGHRLSLVEQTGSFAVGDAKLDTLVPRKTLAELAKLADGAETIEIAKDDNHLAFRLAFRAKGRTLTSRLLTGQFPNYELVLPKDHPYSVTLERDAYLNAVKQVHLMADERSHSVKLTLSRDNLKLTSQSDEAGDAEANIGLTYEGPDTVIGINATYLLDALPLYDGPINLTFKDGGSQLLLVPGQELGFDWKYVLMPMRVA